MSNNTSFFQCSETASLAGNEFSSVQQTDIKSNPCINNKNKKRNITKTHNGNKNSEEKG